MEKTIIDENTGWEYELIDEQYYSTGRVMKDGRLQPETVDADNGSEEDYEPKEEKYIGVWAQQHLRYIKSHKKNLYFELYVSGRLNEYLVEIEAQAEDMFFRVVKEMAAREGVTETLKAEKQMEWIQHMNSLRHRATEIVNHKCIYI